VKFFSCFIEPRYWDHAIDLCLRETSILWTYSCCNFFLLLIQSYINLWIMEYCLRCLHYYVHTYIQCGHIWHRNKLSRCQLDLLVSCSNDEHQTSLKWDRSSHPIAPECSVSHTLRLKMFTINVLPFCVSCNVRRNVPAEWQAVCNVRCKLSRQFSHENKFLAYFES